MSICFEQDDFPFEDVLCVGEEVTDVTLMDQIEEEGEEIFTVDDGMGENALLKFNNQFFWNDRHCGMYQVKEQLVNDILSQMT